MTARVETKFTADTRDIERRLAQLDNRIDKFAQRSARSMQAVQNSVQQIDRTTANLGRTLSSMAGTFAAAFSTQEAIRLADTFTRFEAKLINANVAAKDMAETQERLFAIAKANGSEIVSVAELFGSLTTATSDLKTSQADLMTITEGVAAALKVSGAGAAQASSVILQLSQAIAGGKLQAQEYNSIIDASPALFQGLAKEIPGVNGSLGRLRQAMLDGKLTVDVLIPALTRMSDEMVNKAAKAPLTVEASLQNLQTSLVQYVGQADQSLGATEKLSFAIKLLGENLDLVAGAIGVVGTVLVARGVASVAAYTGSMVVNTVASARMASAQISLIAAISGTSRASLLASTAMTRLSASMAFFGGPIGIAIIAIAAAVYLLKKRSDEGSEAMQQLKKQTDLNTTAADKYREAVDLARQANGEAKKAALELAQARRQETIQLIANTKEQLKNARAALASARARQVASENYMNSFAGVAIQAGGGMAGAASRASVTQGRQADVNNAQTVVTGYERELARAEADLKEIDAEAKAPPPVATVTAPTSRGDRSGSRSSASDNAPDPDEVRRNSEELERSTSRRITELQAELGNTAEARHQLALQRLEWEREDATRAVDQQLSDKAITEAAAISAKAAIQTAHDRGVEVQNAARAREIEEKRIDALREQAAYEDNIARILDATARNRAGQADTLAERLEIEREAFTAYQAAEKAAMEARHEEARARERLNGAIDAEAERRRQGEAAAFEAFQNSERGSFDNDQRNKNPFAKHVDAAKDWQANVMTSMSEGLETLGDDLTDVIMRTKDLGDMFSNVSKQIVADLMRIAVQKAVIGPLANMLGFGDGGGFMSLFGIGKTPAKKAIGTNMSQGGMTLVGESGPELLNLPKGTQVLPNGDVRKLRNATSGGRNGAPVFNFQTTVHANDTVLASQIRNDIAASQITATNNAVNLMQQNMVSQQRGAVRR